VYLASTPYLVVFLTIRTYSFVISAFNAASASISPSVVLAALFCIAGVSSFFVLLAFFAAAASFFAAFASAR